MIWKYGSLPDYMENLDKSYVFGQVSMPLSTVFVWSFGELIYRGWMENTEDG